jgi:hypothetical protein
VVTWTNVTDEQAERTWDEDLERLAGQSLVQTYRWGVYKAAQGWTPTRWIAHDDRGNAIAMVQALVRAYPWRVAVVWCPGGAVGAIDAWGAGLFEEMQRSMRARRLYCRAAFSRPKTLAEVNYLRSHGWARPRRTVSAPSAMIWTLPPTEQQALVGLSANWRHNLTRAQKRGGRVVRWSDSSTVVLERVYAAMNTYKKLAHAFDPAAFSALASSLGDRLVVYASEDEDGVPLAVRGCAIHGRSAWDVLAATSPQGRRRYASYAVLWALVRHCQSLGVATYDLGGIDPRTAAGVYDFKRGTGAREYECLGEWEWTSSPLLAHAVNLKVQLRPGSALA